MNYLLHLNGWYYFNRRVPFDLKGIDSRLYVRAALKTDSKKEAIRLIGIQNERVENYWQHLITSGQSHNAERWKSFNRSTRLARFTEDCYDNLSTPPHEFSASIKAEKKLVPESPRLSKCLDNYWRFEKQKTLNKSSNQIRKWQNPRKLAIRNFISCIGDKPVATINRDDMLTFRDWWIQRINQSDVTPSTVNKNLVLVKTILESVSDNLRLNIDIKYLFRKLMLADDDQARRLPFEKDYIVNTLLNSKNLKGLNEQAKWVLNAIAETGASISEQVGLMPEDIVLNHDIPHIIIVPRQKKALKTKYRKRIIPITGFALDAFKACPNGFTDYRERPDSLSGVLSKFLKENNLLPTDKHTVYSLRHSFQDRLLAANAPDRVQADLMGHKFNRPVYGDGASLEQKKEWMEKIKLKTNS